MTRTPVYSEHLLDAVTPGDIAVIDRFAEVYVQNCVRPEVVSSAFGSVAKRAYQFGYEMLKARETILKQIEGDHADSEP